MATIHSGAASSLAPPASSLAPSSSLAPPSSLPTRSERRLSLVDSAALNGAVRRLSIAAGAIEPDSPSVVSEQISAKFLEIEEKHETTLWQHFYRSNIDAVLTAVPGCCVIYGLFLLIEWLATKESSLKLLGDKMVVSEVFCQMVVEFIMVCTMGNRAYYIRRAIQWPVQIPVYFGSCGLLDWQPSLHSMIAPVGLMSLAQCLGYFACTVATKQHGYTLARVFLSSIGDSLVHFFHVVIIGLHVVPTKIMARDFSPLLVSVCTGGLYPFANFLLRKGMINKVSKNLVTHADNGEIDDFVGVYAKLMKKISVCVLLAPAVLMYLNTSLYYAAISVMMQAAGEVLLKVYVAWSTKHMFRAYIEMVAAGNQDGSSVKQKVIKLSAQAVSEPGLSTSINWEAGLEKANGAHKKKASGPNERSMTLDEKAAAEAAAKKELERQLKRAMALLAIRWHGEIVAEKACLLCAGLIAMLAFGDRDGEGGGGDEGEGEGRSVGDLAVMTGLFVCVESAVDVVFVYLVDVYMGEVPILRVVPHEKMWSKSHAKDSAMTALAFGGVALIIFQACYVDLN